MSDQGASTPPTPGTAKTDRPAHKLKAQRMGPGLIALIVLAVLLVGALAYVLVMIVNQPVPVPSVHLQTHAQAATTLEQARLTLGMTSEVATGDVAVGLVVSQKPEAGRSVKLQSPVNIWVAVKPELVRPPVVTGMTKTKAEGELRAAMFVPVTYNQYSDTVPAGTVVSQLPRDDAPTLTGTNVAIFVSLGSGTGSTVPKVVGLNQTDATLAIGRVGLEPMWLANNVSSKPAGEIIDQAPDAGTIVPPGTPVAAVVVLPE